ncbi:hypothetical protein ID856_14305 [Xenorhabdus sp. 18]|uniref:hypothetical protein n=1 Tax=Xenorhabdus doucetiae TaxID=351671 RepID=UPI0019B3A2DE|nr:hypothetical protein [Xenorhabdus sp. 18]MBD2797698.1 hypothetical protein [Xenorhabdus sp. 18]
MENRINDEFINEYLNGFILYLTERGINSHEVAHTPELMDKYMLEYYKALGNFRNEVLAAYKESPILLKRAMGFTE